MTRYVLFLVITAIALAGTYRAGGRASDERWQARTDAAQAEAMSQTEQLQQQARELERKSAEAMGAIDSAYQRGRTDAQAEAGRTIADLRAGAVRLRERFTCPAGTAGGVPTSSTSTGGSDAAQGGGLSAEDAGFLVRLAEQADAVTLQLQACQAVVRRDLGQ